VDDRHDELRAIEALFAQLENQDPDDAPTRHERCHRVGAHHSGPVAAQSRALGGGANF
jgi:hypothetical protein